METTVVYISKYALTQGIFTINAGLFEETGNCYDTSTKQYYVKKEWHRTGGEALADAERRRVAKIQSLEKQLAKLRALNFVPGKENH